MRYNDDSIWMDFKMIKPITKTYQTQGGVAIQRSIETINYVDAIEPIITALDQQRGVLLASSFEYPGRYTRWDIGFVNPPLQIVAKGQEFSVEALNERGKILMPVLAKLIQDLKIVQIQNSNDQVITGVISRSSERFPEELRSKQPSIFSLLRVIQNHFYSDEDAYLGLYGAFGYDLAFQFEPINLRIPRAADQRDLVLFLPDEIYLIDHRREMATINRYEFTCATKTTVDLPRKGTTFAFQSAIQVEQACDHHPGEYAACVHLAKEYFKRGDLFEVVPGQTFYEPCLATPAEIFRRLRERNPSPYGFLINLGDAEYLVGASPEMYVRVTGKRIETCPISGTIARGKDAIGDAGQILKLLNSKKEASELTMCTDVDRNDKSRICEPGSIKVIGRRLIEMYSRLIHTVDHVEGVLRAGYDALDGFLSHTWAVTVTGAPKAKAMQFIEDHEHTARYWYGGAVGLLAFNGDMNTGLTLRTVRIKNGVAQVRVGATLLYDSIPEEEEKETELKAAALLDAIRRSRIQSTPAIAAVEPVGQGKKILLVDHQDSFVHTLANYLQQTGAETTTLRPGFSAEEMQVLRPDLVVLSPGPGRPIDFDIAKTIAMVLNQNIPLFGVCLGLQGIVEYFGGKLDVLEYPMHGKPSAIKILGGQLFTGLSTHFLAGRYHSLYADKKTFPTVLKVTAESVDGVIMAVEHQELPIWAVQFHPESIMSLEGNSGLLIIQNVVKLLN